MKLTNLEQLAALIELLDSPVHADAETHDSERGACTECPVPLFSRPPLEIAQAIHDAGWTPPAQQTAKWRDYHSPPPPMHNHITRDIKAPGKCPGCDHN